MVRWCPLRRVRGSSIDNRRTINCCAGDESHQIQKAQNSILAEIGRLCSGILTFLQKSQPFSTQNTLNAPKWYLIPWELDTLSNTPDRNPQGLEFPCDAR